MKIRSLLVSLIIAGSAFVGVTGASASRLATANAKPTTVSGCSANTSSVGYYGSYLGIRIYTLVPGSPTADVYAMICTKSSGADVYKLDRKGDANPKNDSWPTYPTLTNVKDFALVDSSSGAQPAWISMESDGIFTGSDGRQFRHAPNVAWITGHQTFKNSYFVTYSTTSGQSRNAAFVG